MNFATSSGLLLLGLFLLPVLVSGCLPYGRDGVPWYEAAKFIGIGLAQTHLAAASYGYKSFLLGPASRFETTV